MVALLLLLSVQIGPAAAGTPNRQPQLGARGNAVAVAYGAGNAIYLAASTDGGTTFGPPVLVSSQGELALGMHRGPRVAYTRQGIVISAVVGERGKGKDGDVLAWRSLDGGKSWSAPVRVNDAAGSAREGLHAMAFGGRDTLFAAWLDLREKGTRIYGATSTDGGASWSANHLVYESPSRTVCQCCHPSVAMDGSGVILVMFRNALEGSRDMYLARSTNGGKTFEQAQKVGGGTWKLEACPMDGGGVTVDEKGQAATIWRREGTIFATRAGDPEKPLGEGRNPATVATKAGVYSAWTEGPSVRVKTQAAEPETVDEDGAFPALAVVRDGSAVVAWESKGAIVIRKVR
jgi:hypothetical protein